MKKVLLVLILSLLFLSPVRAGIMMGEGSITIRAGEEKPLRFFCVFSENQKDTTYTPVFTDNLKKFIKSIEPESFTLSTLNCTGTQTERRKCLADYCNKKVENQAVMPLVTFKGPLEFSFDFCDGLPCLGFYGKLKTYQGGIRNVGSVGAAKTVEVLDFWIHYYPFNGWIIVIFILILVLILVVWRLATRKTESQVSAEAYSRVVDSVWDVSRHI